MSFLLDVHELKTGLIIFRRSDVKHRKWYCRIRVPASYKYKVVSLRTTDIREAKDKAIEADADIRFRVRHQIPVFEKTFAEVSKEYFEFRRNTFLAGQISSGRLKTIGYHIKNSLDPYLGNLPITQIGNDKWLEYPFWRKQNCLNPEKPPKDDTIKSEMVNFNAIMNFAASRGYIQEKQIPKGKVKLFKGRREEFTPSEYKQLYTYARKWVNEGRTNIHTWHRKMAYDLILILSNTGIRTIEARNLRWRDIGIRKDNSGRNFIVINVRGKDKYRELIAPFHINKYFERIKTISNYTNPNDFVFPAYDGSENVTLYSGVLKSLLIKSDLLFSSNGKSRSAYCFRHTYATFRLMEGVDVYFLAKQMGTSVQMIEDHYGHITPSKNAERILQGIPGWEPISDKTVKVEKNVSSHSTSEPTNLSKSVRKRTTA